MSQLVKFTTNDDIDNCLESLKMSHPNCNTNAAAAKLALLNYESECDHHRETKKTLKQAVDRLTELEEMLVIGHDLEQRKKAYLAKLLDVR